MENEKPKAYTGEEDQKLFRDFTPCPYVDGQPCIKEECPHWVKTEITYKGHTLYFEGCAAKISPIINARLHDAMAEYEIIVDDWIKSIADFTQSMEELNKTLKEIYIIEKQEGPKTLIEYAINKAKLNALKQLEEPDLVTQYREFQQFINHLAALVEKAQQAERKKKGFFWRLFH